MAGRSPQPRASAPSRNVAVTLYDWGRLCAGLPAALADAWADACDIAKYLRRWELRRGVALRGVRANDVAVTGQYRPPGLAGQTASNMVKWGGAGRCTRKR